MFPPKIVSSTSASGRRDIGPGDGSQLGASPMQKRDAPSGDDLRYAEGLIGEMRQSNELRDEVELTPNLEDFTARMKITGEQGDLVKELNGLQGEDECVQFLKIVELVAMEQ